MTVPDSPGAPADARTPVGLRSIAAADCPPQPWPNGGGLTRDLVLAPASAPDGPRFDWRLSLADIDRDGPFSSLPGVDRVFALVEGRLALDFGRSGALRPRSPTGDPAAVTLDARAEPLAFDGEAAPFARIREASRALNLMLARGRCVGVLRRSVLPDRRRLACDPDAAARACWPGARPVAYGAFVVGGMLALGGVGVGAGTLLWFEADGPDARAAGADPATVPSAGGAAASAARAIPTDRPQAIGPVEWIEIVVARWPAVGPHP